MQVEALGLPDVRLIRPVIHRDARGFFSETFNAARWADHGLPSTFVQDNHAMSKQAGVVRGLHYQIAPFAQGKLVRVTRGAILDVAVDIRKGSPTYGQHVAVELSAENWCQIWVPAGFAHGYCTRLPETEVVYKVTHAYAPDCEFGLAWDDPELAIDWPVGAGEAIVSDKDRKQSTFAELPDHFSYQSRG
jgi:dTDP-4-dehydrorhamnose 3,5-epimerase